MSEVKQKISAVESSSTTSSRQRGSFLTEMTLVLPFLFVLLIGTIDLSIGMLTYLRVSRVAYEAARYGASLSGISASYDPNLGVCDQITPGTPLSKVITRAQRIVASSILFSEDVNNDLGYKVSYDSASRQIHVCVTVRWKSVMPGVFDSLGLGSLGNSNIKAIATAPYLFSS